MVTFGSLLKRILGICLAFSVVATQFASGSSDIIEEKSDRDIIEPQGTDNLLLISLGTYRTSVFGHDVTKGANRFSTMSYVAGFGLGKRINSKLDLTLEYNNYFATKRLSYAQQETNTLNSISWSTSSQLVSANIILAPFHIYRLDPYIKLGFGLSRNEGKDIIYNEGFPMNTRISKGRTVYRFAYQLGMGIKLHHSKKINIMLEYAWINRGKFTTHDSKLAPEPKKKYNTPKDYSLFMNINRPVVPGSQKKSTDSRLMFVITMPL